MRFTNRLANRILSGAIVVAAMALPASGQSASAPPGGVLNQPQPSATVPPATAQVDFPAAPAADTVQQLLNSAGSDIKFDLRDLMEILRDRRHEGWVLAAYPDPKTGQPLIGAGFSLDLPAREHPQSDSSNPHQFLEPSSAELWQAAGLDPARLQTILDQFHERLAAWSKKGFRKRIATLEPQITDEEATQLFRVFALQAVYNARGYSRYFDRLTGAQQMAVSQLVYQMGFNLQEFGQFLDRINSDTVSSETGTSLVSERENSADAEYWKAVQQSLIRSEWARRYRIRAVAVIAMLDPQYGEGPGMAERRVGQMLRPAVLHRRRGRSAAAVQLASSKSSSNESRPRRPRRGAKLRQHRRQAA